MTTVKGLAVVALVATVAARAASAGALDYGAFPSGRPGGFTGVVGPDPSLFARLPAVAAAPLPTLATSPAPAADASLGWSKYAVVDNAATLYANAHGGMASPTSDAPTPMGTGFSSTVAPASAPAFAAPAPAPAPVAAATTYDAFVNLGSGPYPEANYLTSGNAQPWYNSPNIVGLFGGHPSTQQQADFTAAVLQHVQQTFSLGGVPVNLTTDPTAQAAHTLSVVSNTANGWMPDAIGMTTIGGNGFDFIDQAAKSARTVDQLAWIVAHNVSHELMLAFGVGENYDKSGNFIDATNANWSMMVSPTSTFSQGAARALLAANFQADSGVSSPAAQLIGPQPIPEPTTVALWSLAAAGIVVARRRRP